MTWTISSALNISILLFRIYFQTSDLYSVFVWIVIACSIVHMSVAIFQLDLVNEISCFEILMLQITCGTSFWQAYSTSSKGSLLDYIMMLLASLSNLFLYCYFGKQATESFNKMTDALYESKWLDFTPKERKYFVIAITNTQRPLYYHGFNIMVLNLESFTNVRHFSLSRWKIFQESLNWISSTGSQDSRQLLHDVQNAKRVKIQRSQL